MSKFVAWDYEDEESPDNRHYHIFDADGFDGQVLILIDCEQSPEMDEAVQRLVDMLDSVIAASQRYKSAG